MMRCIKRLPVAEGIALLNRMCREQLAGADPGSKLAKAEALGTEVIDEDRSWRSSGYPDPQRFRHLSGWREGIWAGRRKRRR